jgi:hypothetical protein
MLAASSARTYSERTRGAVGTAMNITFSVDERVPGQAQRDAVIEELRSLALKGRSPEPGWRFDRDEIYAPRAERRRGA